MLYPDQSTTDTTSDAELAQRMSAGDTVTLERVMRRYNQSLYRAARSILKNEQDAEEAVQDAYLKGYRNIGQFHGQAKLSTWLTRIVINEALVRQRKHRRRAAIIPIDADAAVDSPTAEDSPMPKVTSASPERDAERAEVRRLIERNIDKLPDAFRCVFVLRALEEMTVEETASCLDIAEATVRSRYFRARGLMREAIAREIDLNHEDAFSFAGTRCDRIVAGVMARLAGEVNNAPAGS
jgi:RNA polymerase sigma-70 factor (ECF subfamily)